MSAKIYVGNLSFNATEDALKSQFETYGTVQSCKIITDRETGRSKGFGFVEMDTAESTQKAIEAMNGTELDGRPLKVNLAQPKTDRPRSRRPR